MDLVDIHMVFLRCVFIMRRCRYRGRKQLSPDVIISCADDLKFSGIQWSYGIMVLGNSLMGIMLSKRALISQMKHALNFDIWYELALPLIKDHTNIAIDTNSFLFSFIRGKKLSLIQAASLCSSVIFQKPYWIIVGVLCLLRVKNKII